MATSCITTPTLTRTDQVTSQALSTTFSNSVSTAPPTTTATVIHTCIGATTNGSVCSTVDSTVPITIPGFTTTIAVPVTLTVQVTAAQVTTLFGTSCSAITQPNNPQNPPSSPSSSTTTSSSTFAPALPLTSQESTFISSSATTLADGLVTTQQFTITTTLPPTATGTTPDAAGGAQQTNQTQNQDGNKSTSTNLAPIIGGVVGGFFGLFAIVFTIWFIVKRRKRWDDIFEKEDDFIAAGVARHGKDKPDLTAEPRPYEYGLVGHGPAPSATSPPGSPPLLAATALPGDSLHGRNRSSLTPLMAAGISSRPSPGNNGLQSSSTISTTRPSTAGSTHPLVSSGSYFPPSIHTHSQSTGSMTGSPVTHAQQAQHWGAPELNYAPPPVAAPVGGVGRAVSPEDPAFLHRSGSPVSIQEQRILQVTNALPGSPIGEAFGEASSSSSAAAAAAASSSQPQRDGKGRPLGMGGQKAPLVHLDGGRFQQGVSSEPAPPSYDD